jgi:hypothetical protein
MSLAMRAVLLSLLLLSGCRTADDVATSSYQGATAPVRADQAQAGTTTVTTTTTHGTQLADGGEPLQTRPTPPTAARRDETSLNAGTPSTESRPRTTSSPVASQLEFPTAKPVEGKPGYVYSPFDPSKYVDVSGYTPGSKVKDPYSGKIFLVP